MKTTLLFCHGWSLKPDYWKNLLPKLSDFDCQKIDLEYYQVPQIDRQSDSSESIPYSSLGNKNFDNPANLIGIGHSIGLIKLIQSGLKFKALIGLQSCLNFLHTPPLRSIRTRNLKALQKYLLSDPINTLSKFHQQLGLSNPLDLNNLNLEKLSADLNLLEQDFSGAEINCPLMILSSNNDIVVPAEISQGDFASYPNVCFKEIKEAQHALGFLKAQETAIAIREFVNEQF